MAAAPSLLLFSAVVPALLRATAAVEQTGQEVHCVGDRAHVLHYRVVGEAAGVEQSLHDLEHAEVSLQPAPHQDAACGEGGGGLLGSVSQRDRRFCFGANQDADQGCHAAKTSSLPLVGGLACEGCYAGATADLYYMLNWTGWRLNSFELGVRDIHLRSSATIDMQSLGMQMPIAGSLQLSNKKITVIDRLVACPVCLRVKITVEVPTMLNYTVDAEGAFKALGATLHIHLGDQGVRWSKEDGWHRMHSHRSIVATPVLPDDAHGRADVDLKFGSSVKLDLDSIAWFSIGMQSSMDLHADAQGSWAPGHESQSHMCMKGDAELSVVHEADLHWSDLSLFGLSEFHHWGPKADFTWSRQRALFSCPDNGTSSGTAANESKASGMGNDTASDTATNESKASGMGNGTASDTATDESKASGMGNGTASHTARNDSKASTGVGNGTSSSNMLRSSKASFMLVV